MNPEGLSSTREVLKPYPELKRLGLEFASVTSSYPYGPYMGFTSYAHPIIPETEDADSLNESFNKKLACICLPTKPKIMPIYLYLLLFANLELPYWIKVQLQNH